jgi:hypothetical protein
MTAAVLGVQMLPTLHKRLLSDTELGLAGRTQLHSSRVPAHYSSHAMQLPWLYWCSWLEGTCIGTCKKCTLACCLSTNPASAYWKTTHKLFPQFTLHPQPQAAPRQAHNKRARTLLCRCLLQAPAATHARAGCAAPGPRAHLQCSNLSSSVPHSPAGSCLQPASSTQHTFHTHQRLRQCIRQPDICAVSPR